jgi:hypothetical protein
VDWKPFDLIDNYKNSKAEKNLAESLNFCDIFGSMKNIF